MSRLPWLWWVVVSLGMMGAGYSARINAAVDMPRSRSPRALPGAKLFRPVGADATVHSFSVLLRDGTSLHGKVRGLDAEHLFVEGSRPWKIPWGDILEMHQALPPAATPPCVLLANGDRVPGQVTTLDARTVQIALTEFAPGQSWSLPAASLLGVWRQLPQGHSDPDRVRWAWRHDELKMDRLLLTDGDLLEGTLLQIDRTGWLVQSPLGRFTLPAARVASWRRPGDLAPEPAPGKAVATLRSGTRLTFQELALQQNLLHGRTVHGTDVKFSADELLRLEFTPAQVVPLVRLVPKAQKQEPYFDLSMPLVTNGDVQRHPLRQDGRVAEQGLGMMSRQEVEYSLDGKYHTFLADVGLQQALPHRSPKVTVLVDGQVRFHARLSAEQPRRRIWLDLGTAQRLTLRVEHGSGSNGPSAVNWLEPRLLR